MKRLVIIFFLILSAYSFVGYYVQLNIMLYSHKQYMLIRPISGQSKTIILSSAQFYEQSKGFRMIDKKECRYNGQLYDVLEVIQKGGLVYIYCINDTKEERLLAELNQNYSMQACESPAGKDHHSLKNFLKDYFFIPSFTSNSVFVSMFSWSINFINFAAQFTPPVSSPPPQVA